MKKTLSCLYGTLMLFAVAMLLLFFPQNTSAQCGNSPFNEGGTLAPNAAWNNVNVGSGTYVDFNVVQGRIYSFRYTGSTVAGYDWDMTLSTTSTILPYDNSLTPLRNSWTGGLGCPITSSPLSAEWFSTFTGTVRVNTHLRNAICNDWVAGVGSATLQYKECLTTPDPGPGINQWNVDAYVTTDLSIPQPTARYGYYVDPNLNLSTTTYWNSTLSPSHAAGWVGCGEVPNDNFVVRARRTGFPCGVYQLFADQGDDNVAVYLNGTQIFSHGCCINSATVVGDPNGYLLSSTDNLEVRFNGLCGTDNVLLRLAPVNPTPFDAGVIGGVANNSNICEGIPLGQFTNVTPASGGVLGFANSQPIYSWEISTDGGVTYNPVAGANSADWNSPTLVPPGATYVIRRHAQDGCGNNGVSNAIVVTGQPSPNGSFTPSNTTICPGASATLTVNFSPGTGPFSFNYSDGLNTFSQVGFNSGGTITVTPPVTSSYNLTAIQDAYGCIRTSGFTGGALVQVAPNININNIATSDVSCNGGSNGSITINASGGIQPLSYSDNGGGSYQASNVFSGLPIGSYNVSVHDSLGCIVNYALNPVVISQPTAISFTTTHNDASCANVFDGSITVSASGGVTPYQYSLNGGPLQPGNSFLGLAANTYVVYVYDRNGCVDTASVTIANTYVIGVNIVSQTDVTCFGAADGSVVAQVIGGVPPYEYSINGNTFQTSDTFSGLSGGTYIIVGRDSKGCTESTNVTISQPSPVTVTIDSITDVTCFGSASGSIYITPAGGVGPYTYLWSDNSNNEDLLNVQAGTYSVIVTDTHNCTATNGATIGQPLELFVNIASVRNPLCSADSSGFIDVIANGGVPPYTYAWDNGSFTEFQTNLNAGTYTVTVSDANGCQKILSQTLTDPTPLVSSVVGTDVSCFGASDGAADLTVSGGTMPYFYQWSTFQATEDITMLHGGLYYVLITDYNGCVKRDSAIISEPAPLTLTTAVTNISCFNSADGSIDLTVTGGTPGYTYIWNDGVTTEDRTGLQGGTYSVTVTDTHNCTATISVLIVNPSLINTSFIITDPRCYADSNGAIDMIPSGGTAPYTFNWSNAATTEDLSAVPAGTYVVTITDSRGCVKVDSATVIQPPILYTSGIITNVSCHGLCNGAIDITAYGGTLPYNYSWSSGPSTEDLVHLCGGNYIVTVTDNHSCTVASLYVISEPTVLTTTIVSSNVSCNGGNNGHAAVTPSGGTTPYEYLWNTFATDSSINGLTAGHYVVLVTDSNRCHVYDSTDVLQPAPISISAVITNVQCGGSNTGAIDITVTGGTSPYTFAWSFGPTTEDVSNLTAGVYAVTVTDANGCQKVDSFEVIQTINLFTNVSVSNPVCSGSNNGFVAVDVTGGSIPYNYSWNTAPVQNGAIATNLYAGTYSVTITDANSCTATVSATLTDPQPITVTTSSSPSKCANNATGYVIASVTGGTPPYIFSLNGVTLISSQAIDTLTGLAPGQYVIQVSDANGCSGTQTFTVDAPDQITVDLQAPQSVILQGMTTQLIATASSGAQAITHYIWSPTDSFNVFDFTGCADSTDCSSPYVAPRYTTVFTVTAVNEDSCFASDTVTITVLVEPKAFIPTAFTPNGDGLNDHFEFDILGATDINIAIFDRWGSRVYANDHQPNGINGHNGWDGTKDGKALPYDTYVYQMKVTYFNGTTKNIAGTVNIMK